jgi:hypothetical protein
MKGLKKMNCLCNFYYPWNINANVLNANIPEPITIFNDTGVVQRVRWEAFDTNGRVIDQVWWLPMPSGTNYTFTFRRQAIRGQIMVSNPTPYREEVCWKEIGIYQATYSISTILEGECL